MFSLHGLLEMVKSLLKAAVVGGVARRGVREREHIFALISRTSKQRCRLPATVLFSALLIVMGLRSSS